MTRIGSKPHTRKIAFVALAIGLVTAIAMWLTSLSSKNESVFLNIGLIAIGLVIAVVASVVLDVVAGRLGGTNGILAIAGGVLLVSPVILVVVGLIQSLFVANDWQS